MGVYARKRGTWVFLMSVSQKAFFLTRIHKPTHTDSERGSLMIQVFPILRPCNCKKVMHPSIYT
jgi:hypothetical protein